METLSTADLEREAIASLEPGFVPKSERDKESAAPDAQETPAQKQQANNQDTSADDSATEDEPTEEVEGDATDDKTEPKPEAQKPDLDKSKKDKENERKDNAWKKVSNRHRELTEWESELSTRRSNLDRIEGEKVASLSVREQRTQEIEGRLMAQIHAARNGKLPDYRASDGKMYPAADLQKYVGDSFAAGEEAQGNEGLKELLGLARQSGVLEATAPSNQQMQHAIQQRDLAIARRPDLAPSSGSKVSEVLKVLFTDQGYANMIAGRPEGISEAITLADWCAKGMEATSTLQAKDNEIAELRKQLGEKAKSVAHFEKTSAPARAGVTRRPSAPKSPESSSAGDMEKNLRGQFDRGELKW